MKSRISKRRKISNKISVDANEKAKQEWTTRHAKRILNCWQSLKTPFGVSQQYVGEIQTQLSSFYDIPEERLFIEMSYR
jgi:hypothetical protein